MGKVMEESFRLRGIDNVEKFRMNPQEQMQMYARLRAAAPPQQLLTREELAAIKQLLSNVYYKTNIKPALDIKGCLAAFVNLDVVDIATFFQREQVIGELRTYVRLEQLLENRVEELEFLLKQEQEELGEE